MSEKEELSETSTLDPKKILQVKTLLKPFRISKVKNLLKYKGFSYDTLSNPNTANGLYQIIYVLIVKYYPTFPGKLLKLKHPNADESLLSFDVFQSVLRELFELSLEYGQLVDENKQEEKIEEEKKIESKVETNANENLFAKSIEDFSGLAEINKHLNKILFTYKEYFGNISIWNVTDSQDSEMKLHKKHFSFGGDNYLLPELNILFLDNEITLLIPCHDKFMKQNNETFLSSKAISLEDFIQNLPPLSLENNGPEQDDAASEEERRLRSAREKALTDRENNERIIQESGERIAKIKEDIANLNKKNLPLGPIEVQQELRDREIKGWRDQIESNEKQIREREAMNEAVDKHLRQLLLDTERYIRGNESSTETMDRLEKKSNSKVFKPYEIDILDELNITQEKLVRLTIPELNKLFSSFDVSTLEQIDLDEAAAKIQAIQRRNKEVKRKRKKTAATQKIQNIARGHAARKRVKKIREEAAKEDEEDGEEPFAVETVFDDDDDDY